MPLLDCSEPACSRISLLSTSCSPQLRAENCEGVLQAEEFLKANSTNASVPSAPLSMVQASAAALDMGMDRAVSACLSERCKRCASPPRRAESTPLSDIAGACLASLWKMPPQGSCLEAEHMHEAHGAAQTGLSCCMRWHLAAS